ncbi:MAG TPA: stage V sporulation protein B [Negativicutes bacterium]|nr:stage V sporulation protein B [Negativicutes bacterium]
MSKDTFIKGALILTIAGVVVKVIGAVNRILLSRLLGGEGIGLYQLAYPIYLLALSISSAGIPVAISILVAEKVALKDYRGANKVFRLSLMVLAVLGSIFTGLLWFGAQWLIDWHFIRDPRAYYAILALAPAIFFVTILSSYRGYFQGLQMMVPSAISQIAEQLLRVATMIVLAYMLLPKGIEYAAAGATFGAAPGAVFGLLVLLYFYYRKRAYFKEQMQMQTTTGGDSSGRIIYRIIELAIPVSLASIMVPIVANIDLLIVPARLEVAGCTTEQATELYGYLTGMAVSLINLPTILTASLAASLVPAISEAYTLGNQATIINRTSTAMRLTMLICFPSFVGMWLLATPISRMLYGTPNAGTSIAILSLGIVFLGIHQTTTGVLQGLGRTGIPVKNLVFSAVVKIILSYILTAIPGLGIKGAAWATVADFFFAAILNIYWTGRLIGFTIDVRETIKALVAVSVMGVVVLYCYNYALHLSASNTFSTITAIGAGAVSYGIVLLLVGGVNGNDIGMIPLYGNELAKFLKKMGLLRG